MRNARHIVAELLETDEPDVDVGRYITQYGNDVAAGKVTAYSDASRFYHRTKTYKDGVTPIEVRRNGKTQTWKRRPGEFRIPCKYGMYEYFDIDHRNADEWSTVPLPKKEKPVKVKSALERPAPVVNPSDLMPPL